MNLLNFQVQTFLKFNIVIWGKASGSAFTQIRKTNPHKTIIFNVVWPTLNLRSWATPTKIHYLMGYNYSQSNLTNQPQTLTNTS